MKTSSLALLLLIVGLTSCTKINDRIPIEWDLMNKNVHRVEGTYVLILVLPKEYDLEKDSVFVDSVGIFPLYSGQKKIQHGDIVYQVWVSLEAREIKVTIGGKTLTAPLKSKGDPLKDICRCWFVEVYKGKSGEYEIYSKAGSRIRLV